MSSQNDKWITGPKEEFEHSLRRKNLRNRSHYLFLRAHDLLSRDENREAREVLGRALAVADPDVRNHSRSRIETALARLDLAEGDEQGAEEIFRRIVNGAPARSGADGLAHVELAELLVNRGELDEAERLLTRWFQLMEEKALDIHLFRYAVCWARLASTRGDGAAASTWASRALEVAGRSDEFSRHPGVGAARPTKELRDWLEETASCSGGLG
jgi:tetratricopeptide (TPR) repeat protein